MSTPLAPTLIRKPISRVRSVTLTYMMFIILKKIDGAYYTFEDGKMQTGWYKLPAADKNPLYSALFYPF